MNSKLLPFSFLACFLTACSTVAPPAPQPQPPPTPAPSHTALVKPVRGPIYTTDTLAWNPSTNATGYVLAWWPLNGVTNYVRTSSTNVHLTGLISGSTYRATFAPTNAFWRFPTTDLWSPVLTWQPFVWTSTAAIAQ